MNNKEQDVIKKLGKISETDAALFLELSSLLKRLSSKEEIDYSLIEDLFKLRSEISLISEKIFKQYLAVIVRANDLDPYLNLHQ